jgi:hypothetical protein
VAEIPNLQNTFFYGSLAKEEKMMRLDCFEVVRDVLERKYDFGHIKFS